MKDAQILIDGLETIRKDYDHDQDAHRHDNGACRVCIATDTLASYNASDVPETGRFHITPIEQAKPSKP